jgi:hypothetical protein
MDDSELEEVLGRYRPRRPSSGLRQVALAGASRGGRVWPWAVAAAALLAMTIGLSSAADRLRSMASDRGVTATSESKEADGPELGRALEQAALVSAIQERDGPAVPSEEEQWR